MAFALSFPIDGAKSQDDDAFSNDAGLSRPSAAPQWRWVLGSWGTLTGPKHGRAPTCVVRVVPTGGEWMQPAVIQRHRDHSSRRSPPAQGLARRGCLTTSSLRASGPGGSFGTGGIQSSPPTTVEAHASILGAGWWRLHKPPGRPMWTRRARHSLGRCHPLAFWGAHTDLETTEWQELSGVKKKIEYATTLEGLLVTHGGPFFLLLREGGVLHCTKSLRRGRRRPDLRSSVCAARKTTSPRVQ